ncbi:MAG: hypothetical protein JWN40_2143 [Phycisphaerales bacterium]|nr:hypothetical protein [Phycisphaerales bacterium]
MFPRYHLVVVSAFALMLWPAIARAQYQIDNQVGQVDNRVNGELYGNDAVAKERGYQTRLLPSEERYAIWRSGVLPSELEMARRAAGPLTPNGVLDYLPRQSALQRAAGMPEARLFNPGYNVEGARQAGMRIAGSGPQPGYPQTLQQGLQASGRVAGAVPSAAPVRQSSAPPLVPSLTPALDRELPTGPLYDQVQYDPNATPGAKILSQRPKATTQPSLSEKMPKP